MNRPLNGAETFSRRSRIVCRNGAYTGFKLGGNAALQVLELADHIEQLSENS